MFSGNKCVQCWSLDDKKTLSEIIPLLKLNYTKDSSHLQYNHSWMAIDKFQIKGVEIANARYNCLFAFAKIESSQIASKFIDAVAREIAISHTINPVVFIELHGKILVIVSAGTSCFSKIRNNLMKFNDKKVNLWGNLNYKEAKLDNDFFYWLLSKKNKSIKVGKDSYKILDVSGFKSHTEKRLQEYQGTGKSMDTVVPVQAMVCLNNKFTGLSLVVQNKNNDITSFSLDNAWEMKIDVDKTYKIENGKVILYDELDNLILSLYLHVVPGIYEQYNSDKDWSTEQATFKKKVAAQAINEILSETGLKLSELKQMLA